MAISGGDGSIVLTTKIDETALKLFIAHIVSYIAHFVKSFGL